MRLSEFLKKYRDKKYQEFAEEVGISRTTLYNLMHGRDIKLSVAIEIEDVTNRLVTCREIFDEYIKKPLRKSNSPKNSKKTNIA